MAKTNNKQNKATKTKNRINSFLYIQLSVIVFSLACLVAVIHFLNGPTITDNTLKSQLSILSQSATGILNQAMLEKSEQLQLLSEDDDIYNALMINDG